MERMIDALLECQVELRHLRAFAVLAEELHFGRAATRLHIAQPALTKQIQQLERAIGVRLLERTTRSVNLTEAGRAFGLEVQRTLGQTRRALDSAVRAQRGETGVLRVGFAASAPNGVFPHVIRAFRDRYPEVHLELVETWSSRQAEALILDRLDVGFATLASLHSDLLDSQVVQEDPLVVAVHEHHRLAAHDGVALGELADEPFIAFPRSMASAWFDEIVGACRSAGFSPRIAQEVLEINATLGLVAAGLGVALLPAPVQTLQRNGVRYVQIHDVTPTVRTAVAWRRDDLSAVVANFLTVTRTTRADGATTDLSALRVPVTDAAA